MAEPTGLGEVDRSMSNAAQAAALSGAAADLLRKGIDRVRQGDRSGYTCLGVAEAVFRKGGDDWNAGVARQWSHFRPVTD